MITFTLVAILGTLLVIVLMNLFKKDPKPLPTPIRPVEDLANLKVTDARTGDVLSIAGAGDRMTDLDYTVDRWHALRSRVPDLGGTLRSLPRTPRVLAHRRR